MALTVGDLRRAVAPDVQFDGHPITDDLPVVLEVDTGDEFTYDIVELDAKIPVAYTGVVASRSDDGMITWADRTPKALLIRRVA